MTELVVPLKRLAQRFNTSEFTDNLEKDFSRYVNNEMLYHLERSHTNVGNKKASLIEYANRRLKELGCGYTGKKMAEITANIGKKPSVLNMQEWEYESIIPHIMYELNTYRHEAVNYLRPISDETRKANELTYFTFLDRNTSLYDPNYETLSTQSPDSQIRTARRTASEIREDWTNCGQYAVHSILRLNRYFKSYAEKPLYNLFFALVGPNPARPNQTYIIGIYTFSDNSYLVHVWTSKPNSHETTISLDTPTAFAIEILAHLSGRCTIADYHASVYLTCISTARTLLGAKKDTLAHKAVLDMKQLTRIPGLSNRYDLSREDYDWHAVVPKAMPKLGTLSP